MSQRGLWPRRRAGPILCPTGGGAVGSRLAIRSAAVAAAVFLCLGGIPAPPALPAAPPAPAAGAVSGVPASVPEAWTAVAAAGPVSAHAVPEAAVSPPVRRPPASVRSLGVLVTKIRSLKPATYVPKLTALKGTSFRLRPEAAAAYRKMAAAAGKDGIRFRVVSAYRSYARQKQLYAQYTRLYGKAYADRIAARPGRSEHQTGLALDLAAAGGRGQLTGSFASTRESKWLVKNAYKYGFILRYPKGKEKTTGYAFEPWHYRYVGKTISKRMKTHKLKTLEAYYFGP